MSRACRQQLQTRRTGSLVEVWTDEESGDGGVDWRRTVTSPDPEGSGKQLQRRQSDHDDDSLPSGGGGFRRNHSAQNKSSFSRNH